MAVFSEYDVQRVLRSYENSISIHLHCCQLGDWTQVPLYTWIFKHMVGRYVIVAREFDYFKAFVYISTSEISPVLFVMVMSVLIADARQNWSDIIGGQMQYVSEILYADDTLIVND